MSENQAQDNLLTPEDVAMRLHISRLTVGNWLRSGKLKGVKVGRLWRVRESDLETFLKGGERTNGNFS
ncbi:MAG: helix-turn-helix domain-containing protein [Desulfobaccales bacterium]